MIVGMPGLPEILLIVAVLAILFGAKKIPQMANSLGRSLSEFKRGRKEGEKIVKELEAEVKDIDAEIKKSVNEVVNG